MKLPYIKEMYQALTIVITFSVLVSLGLDHKVAGVTLIGIGAYTFLAKHMDDKSTSNVSKKDTKHG